MPAIVKDNFPDDEAYVYVIETNLMQRSFTDLLVSEKVAVLAERYNKVLYRGKRDEIITGLKELGLKKLDMMSNFLKIEIC